jgi:hypothetical protein
MHPPDPEMRRGGPPQTTPDIAESQHRKPYHISPDTQALLIALSPLWFAIVLALCVRGSR